MEWFKGVLNLLSSEPGTPEERLAAMIDAYGESGGREVRATAQTIEWAITSSPILKQRTLEAIESGTLLRYTATFLEDGGAAGYHAGHRDMVIQPVYAPQRFHDRMEMVFLLGHETEHARSRDGVHYVEEVLSKSIEYIANAPHQGPRDYTPAIEAFIEDTRNDEARAHIGGFNAMVSMVHAEGEAPTDPSAWPGVLYRLHPARMSDFIEPQEGPSPRYAMKPGLTLSPDGTLAPDRGNIDAMKTHYADKPGTLGIHGNLDYRHKCIDRAVVLIEGYERIASEVEDNANRRDYFIDYAALRTDPGLLTFPDDGIGHIREALPPVEALPERLAMKLRIDAPSSSAAPPAGDHPLFAQALAALDAMPASSSAPDRQTTRNLAAALAVAAQAHGLSAIDFVTCSTDHRHLIAAQGNDADTTKTAAVDIAVAGTQPDTENLNRLRPMEAPQRGAPPDHAQSRHH